MHAAISHYSAFRFLDMCARHTPLPEYRFHLSTYEQDGPLELAKAKRELEQFSLERFRWDGLPVDIFVQDGDAYLDTDAPLLVLVHNGYGPLRFSDLLPVSVSVLPRVLLRCYEKNLTEKDLVTLKSFIRKHRRTLRHLADGPSSTVRTSHLIKQLMGG